MDTVLYLFFYVFFITPFFANFADASYSSNYGFYLSFIWVKLSLLLPTDIFHFENSTSSASSHLYFEIFPNKKKELTFFTFSEINCPQKVTIQKGPFTVMYTIDTM